MDDLLPYHFNELFTVSTIIKGLLYIFLYIATSEVHIYYDGRMCGQLLVVYPSYFYRYNTVDISMVLLTYIKEY